MRYMIDEGAFAPEYAYSADAGMDLRTPEDFWVLPFGHKTIDTGVHVCIPFGYCGVLMSKSGLNVNKNITSTGLIDSSYTGSVAVKLYNHSFIPRHFKRGDKVSQLVITSCVNCHLEEVDSFPESERGDNGFGSTGR